jgi:thioredoxin 1
MLGAIRDLTNDDFDSRTLEADHIVVVVFWASWCGPCIGLLEEMAILSKETSTEILKLNVDKHEKPGIKYKVLSIPQVNVFSGGQAVQSFVGYKPLRKIREELSLWLSPLDSPGGE